MDGLCNACGLCCNPVTMHARYLSYILIWANQPDPVNDPEYYVARDYNIADPAVVAQIREHIANGTFALRYWTDNIIEATPSGYIDMRCPHYQPATGLCSNYENRPPICVGFPWYGQEPESRLRQRGLYKQCGYWVEVPVALRPQGWKPPTEDELKLVRQPVQTHGAQPRD